MRGSGATTRYDAIVVGGGLAGVTAARDLACDRKKILLLEARPRLGGRVHCAPFQDTGVQVEYGGTYIARSNRHIWRELNRYRLGVAPAPEIATSRHYLGGRVINSPVPVAVDEILSFERACKHVFKALDGLGSATVIEAARFEDYDIPWHAFLDQVELEPATRDLFDAWVQCEGGRHGAELTALSPLWTTSQLGGSVISWHLVLENKIGGGTSALLDAMVRDGGFAVRTACPVARIEQDETDVCVTTASGERIDAAACIVAIPVNCWDQIEFDPPLNDDKQQGAALRPGSYGVKGWALVADAPPTPGGLAAPIPGRSIVLYGTDGAVSDGQLVNFITIPTGANGAGVIDVNDLSAVQREFSQLIPGCRVLVTQGDDLRKDPYSRGSWASYVPGLVRHLAGMRAAEGRLAFAGADIARGFIMWMDGAVQSGGDAATEARRILEQGPKLPQAQTWEKRKCAQNR